MYIHARLANFFFFILKGARQKLVHGAINISGNLYYNKTSESHWKGRAHYRVINFDDKLIKQQKFIWLHCRKKALFH